MKIVNVVQNFGQQIYSERNNDSLSQSTQKNTNENSQNLSNAITSYVKASMNINFGKKVDTDSNFLQVGPEEIKAIQTLMKVKVEQELKTEKDPEERKELLAMKEILDSAMNDKPINSTQILFQGPHEKSKARDIVHKYAIYSGTIGLATAQAPGFDTVALSFNDGTMLSEIADIYKLNNKEANIATFIGASASHYVGVQLFTKTISWLPGLGNAVNCAVAATVTEALGHSFIAFCEERT
jgi:uncharacterized protein (DUF697 family)